MKYRLIIQSEAFGALEDAWDRLAREWSPDAANSWLDDIMQALATLPDAPFRWGMAAENELVEFELRELIHRWRGVVYRALYTVMEQSVRVYYIRHASQRDLEARDFPSPRTS